MMFDLSFTKVLSIMLNYPIQSVHPILEDNLELFNGDTLKQLSQCREKVIVGTKCPVLERRFHPPEKPEIAWTDVRRIKWMGESFTLHLSNFLGCFSGVRNSAIVHGGFRVLCYAVSTAVIPTALRMYSMNEVLLVVFLPMG
jgi:hypothetical protein